MNGDQLERTVDAAGATSGVDLDLDSEGGLEALEAEFAALAERVGAPPFLQPGWLRPWWSCFGRGKLAVATARRAGELVAVLPLRRIRGAVSDLSNWHTPLSSMLFTDAVAARMLADAIYDQSTARVDLSFLSASDPCRELLTEAAADAGRTVVTRVIQSSPYLVPAGDWEAYVGEKLSRNRRQNFRRRRRQLERLGKVSFEVVPGGDRLEETLAEGFAVEAAGWKGKRGSAIESTEPTRRFYAEIARWASTRGWLRLAFLRLDGRPLAFDLCLEQEGVHYMLKTGYDPNYSDLSPGLLLRYEMVRHVFNQGLRYEFLGGEEPYKAVWTDARHEKLRVQAFQPSIAGRLDRFLRTRVKPAIRPQLLTPPGALPEVWPT